MGITADDGTWTIGDNWPWPQVFFTQRYVLAVSIVGTDLCLYELVNESNTWTATKIVVLGLLSRILHVDVADFGRYYIVTVSGMNGSEPWKKLFTRKPNAASALGAVEAVNSGDIPFGDTCCNFKSQVIIGGVQSNNAKWLDLGSCSVAWSGIGSNEFDPAIDPSAGFAKMPWNSFNQAKVYKVKRIGNVVRVYGDRGIADLVPTGIENGVSFGLRELPGVGPGIASGNSIAGDNRVHAFIDTNYDFWIGNEEGVKKLGYRKHLNALTNDRIMMCYDDVKKRFYISDDTYGFVFNEHGLYSTHECLTSVGRFNEILCGFKNDTSDTNIKLTSTPTDFGQQGMKSTEAIEFGVNYVTTSDHELYFKIYGKYDHKEDFILLADAVQLNERGIVTKKMTAREFKFYLYGDYEAGAEFNLDSIRAKIKFSDKRNIRGRVNVT